MFSRNMLGNFFVVARNVFGKIRLSLNKITAQLFESFVSYNSAQDGTPELQKSDTVCIKQLICYHDYGNKL